MTERAIITMREHGHPVGMIAMRFRCTYAQVYDVLKSAGMAEDWMELLYAPYAADPASPKAEQEKTRAERNEGVIAAYKGGMSMQDICKAFSLHYHSVYDVLVAHNVTERRRPGRLPEMTPGQKKVYGKLRYFNGVPRAEALTAALGVQ